MIGFSEFFAVLGLFLIRIGIPLLVLIVIGMLVERAYQNRNRRHMG